MERNVIRCMYSEPRTIRIPLFSAEGSEGTCKVPSFLHCTIVVIMSMDDEDKEEFRYTQDTLSELESRKPKEAWFLALMMAMRGQPGALPYMEETVKTRTNPPRIAWTTTADMRLEGVMDTLLSNYPMRQHREPLGLPTEFPTGWTALMMVCTFAVLPVSHPVQMGQSRNGPALLRLLEPLIRAEDMVVTDERGRGLVHMALPFASPAFATKLVQLVQRKRVDRGGFFNDRDLGAQAPIHRWMTSPSRISNRALTVWLSAGMWADAPKDRVDVLPESERVGLENNVTLLLYLCAQPEWWDEDVANTLTRYGANILHEAESGFTALHFAMLHAPLVSSDKIRWMKEAGANPDSAHDGIDTPLQIAYDVIEEQLEELGLEDYPWTRREKEDYADLMAAFWEGMMLAFGEAQTFDEDRTRHQVAVARNVADAARGRRADDAPQTPQDPISIAPQPRYVPESAPAASHRALASHARWKNVLSKLRQRIQRLPESRMRDVYMQRLVQLDMRSRAL